MRVLKRPPKPANWGATVRQAKREVNKVGRSGGEPDFTDEAKQHWRTFKKNLEDPETKLLRCAYCEVSLTADRYHGDVEHYRPKAAATDRNWHIRNGKQVRGSTNRCTSGYYWLAYEWSNLLLVCFECNQKKASFFPLVGGRTSRTLSEGCEKTETPALLNPYKDKHPEKHFVFDKFGAVTAAGSGTDQERGRETIEICDLDRTILRGERMALAESAMQSIRSYAKAVKANKDPVAICDLRDSLRMQMDAKYPHSGMVRIIFYQMTGRYWTTL